MKEELTIKIVQYILINLGILQSKINVPKLKDNIFLIKDRIVFDDGEAANIYGCSFTIEGKIMKILFSYFSTSELYVVSHLEGTPTYGIFYYADECEEAKIALSLSGKEWSDCNMYLKATYLAAMEQLRDIIIFPEICTEYKNEVAALKSFVNYCFEEKEEENG